MSRSAIARREEGADGQYSTSVKNGLRRQLRDASAVRNGRLFLRGPLVASVRNSGDTPRVARRPAGKAGRPSMSGTFKGAAAPAAGMHRQPNATEIANTRTKCARSSVG